MLRQTFISACCALTVTAIPMAALAGAGDDLELRRYREVLDPHQLACPDGTQLVVEDSTDGSQEVCLAKSGARHGYFLRWHQDGRTWAEVGQFKDGQKHGRWMQFDREGRNVSVQIFSNGELRSERAL